MPASALRIATSVLVTVGLAVAGCVPWAPASLAPVAPPATPAGRVSQTVRLGSAVASESRVTVWFGVHEPLSCGEGEPASMWPPLCVLVTSEPADADGGVESFAGRLVYRPELTYLDPEEVWIRVYDGAVHTRGGLSRPTSVSGFARMTLSSPAGLASAWQEKERGSLAVTLEGLTPGTRLTVFLVERLP